MISFSLIRTIQLGIKSLLLHKLRSFLTMLGIIFGVCSVIAMLAIGEGASHEAQEAIKKLGPNNVIVRSIKPAGDPSSGGARRSFSAEYGITRLDAERIKASIPGLSRLLPMRLIRDEVRFGAIKFPCQVVATLPYYTDITGTRVVHGRFLTPMDDFYRQNVCVLTVALASGLFPYQNPLEEHVKVGDGYYKVVGLVEERGTEDKRPQAGMATGHPLDSNIYISLGTAASRFGETTVKRGAGSFEAEKVELHQVTLQFHDTESVEAAVPPLHRLLGRFHKEKDYELIVPIELLRQAERTKRIFNFVLGSIAAISLLVGGIGIMNIMLATVTERTREIGIRRALGAKKKDIVIQFLVETLVLSIGGGLIGVLLGVVAPFLVERFSDMKTIVTFWSVGIAFGISAAVGIVFGLYPARRAANLDPIEALRHT